MPNFSAGENMCLALLLNGKTFEESKNIVINLMKEVDLDPTLFDRKVTELSGGQRQRIAFVRAFAAKFEVLFGDEPTGNLDEETAHKLMSTLKTYLQKNRKTGIIVSHDIDLALDFADHIFFIKKKGNDQYHYGHLDQNQVFTKKEDSWFFGQRNITSSIRQSIQQIFKSGDIDE